MDDTKHGLTLSTVVAQALQIPGIKVDRETFLREQFRKLPPVLLDALIGSDPVTAGFSREELRKMALALINDRTLKSTAASFIAGMPGGLLSAVTIPADLLQFYGVAIRLAQEIVYLYGEADLFEEKIANDKQIQDQLILYLGVMMGANGAVQATRILSSNLAKQVVKTLPQKALTKTFFYPIVKSIAKAFGLRMTKGIFAKGVSKAIPVIGGIVSGGITYASMLPMGTKLMDAMEQAKFSYSHADLEADVVAVQELTEELEREDQETIQEDMPVSDDKSPAQDAAKEISADPKDVMAQINQAKEMLDLGILSAEEFQALKTSLLAKLKQNL